MSTCAPPPHHKHARGHANLGGGETDASGAADGEHLLNQLLARRAVDSVQGHLLCHLAEDGSAHLDDLPLALYVEEEARRSVGNQLSGAAG